MTVSTRPGEATTRANRRKTKVGRVVSDKMDKTIVVAVERLARHRVYKRVMRVTTKFQAHDEENSAQVGDRVLIEEWRPLSRHKRWRLVEVLGRAGRPIELVSEEPETTEAISAVAHPGRRAKEEAAAAEADAAGADAETDDGADAAATSSDGEPAAAASSPADDASGAGASGPDTEDGAAVAATSSGGEQPGGEAVVAAEPTGAEKAAADKARK
jgi:small subunit ribosomal protein S17